MDVSHAEDDPDTVYGCGCYTCFVDETIGYWPDRECASDEVLTCPDCGTVTAPELGFQHFDPECPGWIVAMVHDEAA